MPSPVLIAFDEHDLVYGTSNGHGNKLLWRGRIIACDGHPLRVPVDVPTEVAPHVLGPGQRIDLALRTPGSKGREIAVMTSGSGGPRRLARVRARGADVGRELMREILLNWTDTALLLRDETLDVALVADSPGDWAFHCHVIEHQKTGLAGLLRVVEA